MKTFTADLLQSYADRVSTIASCIKIIRLDGTTYRFTNYDKNLEIDGETYISSYAFNATAYTSGLGLQIENMEIEGAIDELGITDLDLIKSLFYNAEAWMFSIDYKNIAGGKDKILHGSIGEIEVTDKQYKLEIRGISKKYSTLYTSYYGKMCRVKLGSQKCGVDLNNYYVEGTVLNSDPTSFIDAMYIKLRFKTTVSSAKIRVYELEFLNNFDDVIDIESITYTSNPVVNCNDAISRPLTNIYDGDYDTYACFQTTNYYTQYIYIKLTNRSKIGKIKCKLGQDSTVIELTNIEVHSSLEGYTYLSELDVLTSSYTVNNITTVPVGVLLSSNITSRYRFVSNDIKNAGKENNYFQYGRIEWITGLNSGLQTEVITTDTAGNVELALPMVSNIHPGDTFRIYPGCNHLLYGRDGTLNSGHCQTKFNNILNFRGEPYLPNEDVLLSGYIAVRQDREESEGEKPNLLEPV